MELALSSARPAPDPRDASGRGRLAAVRNALVTARLRPRHSAVLWLDADLTWVPADLAARLHAANPGGIAAPLVLLDDGRASGRNGRVESGGGNALRFYDTAAFAQEGQRLQRTSPPGESRAHHRNYGTVDAWPPYFNYSFAGFSDGGSGGVGVARRMLPRGLRGGAFAAVAPATVACDTVGTVYLVPAAVYRWRGPHGEAVRHSAHALTEHFPLVHAAKYLLRLSVVAVPALRVLHADLPRFGEPFHGNAFDRCTHHEHASFG